MKALVLALVAFTVIAVAPAASAPKHRTVLVVPQGLRTAPSRVGLRDCIAHQRTCVNGVGGLEVAYAVKGTLPSRPTTGTVLTDKWCQPDEYGVSHCTNDIRLASGKLLRVRHDHAMANDPCLAPGEHVYLRVVR